MNTHNKSLLCAVLWDSFNQNMGMPCRNHPIGSAVVSLLITNEDIVSNPIVSWGFLPQCCQVVSQAVTETQCIQRLLVKQCLPPWSYVSLYIRSVSIFAKSSSVEFSVDQVLPSVFLNLLRKFRLSEIVYTSLWPVLHSLCGFAPFLFIADWALESWSWWHSRVVFGISRVLILAGRTSVLTNVAWFSSAPVTWCPVSQDLFLPNPFKFFKYSDHPSLMYFFLVSRGGVRPSSLGISATVLAIVPAPDDEWKRVWSSKRRSLSRCNSLSNSGHGVMNKNVGRHWLIKRRKYEM